MKYKDFKMLSNDDMKQIRGGYDELMPPDGSCGSGCNRTCTLSNGNAGNCYMPNSGPNAGKCFCSGVE